MTLVMNRILLCVGVVALVAQISGCASSAPSAPPPVVTEPPAVLDTSSAESGSSLSDNRMSLPALLLQRQQLCAIPPVERLRLLDDYRAVFVERTALVADLPNFLPERLHKLNGLMLASCDPARTPGVLSEMLGMVTEGHWPAEYMAFFDLLIASHRAYALLDERYRSLASDREALRNALETLRTEYEALQQEHQKTIEGIGDIERGIDAPREDLGL